MTKVLRKPSAPIPPGFVFSSLCAIRNNETLLRLHRAHLSVVLNLTGVAASMLRLATFPTSQVEISFYAVGGIAAIILNYMWFKVLERNSEWLNYWNEKLIELESVCGLEGRVEVYTSDQFTRHREARSRFREGWRLFTVAAMVFWGSVAASAIVLYTAGSNP